MAVSLRGYGGARRQARHEKDVSGGFTRLRCAEPPLDHQIRLGQDPPQLTGGFGGWDVTPRPRAVGMTTWSGVPPFELSLNLMLGRKDLSDSPSQEPLIQQIIDVARGTRKSTPGIVRIDGVPGLPADRWVITGLDWGDTIRRREDMHRIRQILTITFLEYQPPEYESLRGHALRRPRPKTVVYTVRHGDTPAKIARNRRCKWHDIRAVNRKGLIKKANQNLKDGSKINVPVKRHVKKKRRHHHGGGG